MSVGAGMTDGLPTPRRYQAIAALSFGTALVVIDGGIANVALPTIARDLGVTNSASVAVVTIYQLTLVMLLLATCHLPAAWWVLERDWHRVVTALRLAAAIMATLAIVTACAALDAAVLLVPFMALIAEALAIAGLARFEDARSAEESTASF